MGETSCSNELDMFAMTSSTAAARCFSMTSSTTFSSVALSSSRVGTVLSEAATFARISFFIWSGVIPRTPTNPSHSWPAPSRERASTTTATLIHILPANTGLTRTGH